MTLDRIRLLRAELMDFLQGIDMYGGRKIQAMETWLTRKRTTFEAVGDDEGIQAVIWLQRFYLPEEGHGVT